jgi:hypothetical protein
MSVGFHIEALAGNGNGLDVHLVISRRLCELAPALLTQEFVI